MIVIPGYQILAKIYESGNSLVYRGRQEDTNQSVILKILREDYPTPEETARYRKEYEITHSLNLAGVVKAYSLQSINNSLVMILEDFGGESLKILMASQKFTLLGFLKLALKIAESLGEIHAANVIHKDINPSNIVFNPVTGEVKLIDFGISIIQNRESSSSKPHGGLEGTFAYMSPEQTGRMNRTLDYRTDFYSLGATFYELLTQKVPFEGTDPMELVHCHLAKEPVPPDQINAEIPKVVSDIVIKLLAKTAEDRYQSAWGLIADLQECLNQLQANGTIEEFPLGRNDISDKFQIPEKLYGREEEIETLLAAFERVSYGTKEMMLVAGYSGIGKSALVQVLDKPIIQQKGYFISGKFDQFQRTIPYSAIVSAFSELVRLVLTESEAQLAIWREKLLAAFGPNGQIIIDVIPEVELIVGPQSEVPELGASEAQNRFNLVFQNFIRVFCQKEHPLVIFLDDLQWADSATLKLIELMMTDEGVHYLFLIGAYRDNEVSPTHSLAIALEMLGHYGVVINQISLDPLNLNQVAQLIAETLHSDRAAVKPLAELVLQKTQGNPFFVNQFLKTLYQENLLTFNCEQIRWYWNLEDIHALGITDNVVELMIGKLKKMPESTQEVLSLVACLGNQFDLNTLSMIYEKEASETFKHLAPAIQEGLIRPASDQDDIGADFMNAPLLILNYKFLHDRVQQAAYSLIDESQKKAVHLEIGRLLLANTPPEYRLDRVFELVDHLNVARSLITDEAEQIELAQLNLEAGRKAKYATAYVAAQEYLNAGLELVQPIFWKTHYGLTFDLHKEGAEIEYLNGNFERSEALINLTTKQAKSNLEKAEIYNLLIVQYTLRAKYDEGVLAAKKALSMLGIELPNENFQDAIAAEVAQTNQLLAGRKVADLIHQYPMEVEEPKIALKLIINVLTCIYLTNPELWTWTVIKGVNLSLEFGHIPESSICYSTYGLLTTAVFGDYKTGFEFGRLALDLTEQWNQPDIKCKVVISFTNALNYWFKPVKESTVLNNEAYQTALESGSLEYAAYALQNKGINSFVQGKNIGQILIDLPNYFKFATKTKNQLSSDTVMALQLLCMNLSKQTAHKLEFAQEEISEEEYIESCNSRKNFFSLSIYRIFKSFILFLYGNLTEAVQEISEAENLLAFTGGTVVASEYSFYAALIFAAAYENASESQQTEYLDIIKTHQSKLQGWAENSPANYQHKYLLVSAEIARICGENLQAIDLYDAAIESAGTHEFVQNEAIANERAAKFWLGRNKEKIAKLYLVEASYAYQRWGATHKVEELEQRYSHLLAKTPTKASLPNHAITTTHTSTNSSSGVLDLATVMKASLAISSEIVLDKLLASLMKISIENAGAQKGFLIWPRDGKLVISAEASVAQEEVAVQQFNTVEVDSRFNNAQDLPLTVINYVERTRKDVVLNHAVAEGRFSTDPYIAKRQLKSLLCTPIINQGKLVSILYLENNLTIGAFTPERLEVLRLLSSQAAISLENALLYASLEEKVSERTQELNEKNLRLSQTLHELQRTQAQLIQTEKMSSLGQLVAGVAHEINNPVSFIYGNLTPAGEYVKDLLNLIHLYQEHYPHPVAEIINQIDEIDLEFLVEDLQKLLDSMKVGAERIRTIVLSLRNFSRLDEADMKPVDIHEGINSTLMLLQSRLKKEGGPSGIDIIKHYGKLPRVICYASQLNQVFMNIITNAIDALNNTRDRWQGVDKKPTITIWTEVIGNESVKIRFADNGLGMEEEVRHRIFDPFFTTKPVGSGTGLGLSISYSIVVDSHGGNLSCVSVPGEGAEFVVEIPIRPKKSMS